MIEYRTKDVDVLVQDSMDNFAQLAAALMELGARPARTSDRRPITAEDLAIANTQWDTDAGALDVLVSAAWPHDSTVVYADIRRNAGLVEVGGHAVAAASLDDLIRMKEAADRYKDTSPFQNSAGSAATGIQTRTAATTRSACSTSKMAPTTE